MAERIDTKAVEQETLDFLVEHADWFSRLRRLLDAGVYDNDDGEQLLDNIGFRSIVEMTSHLACTRNALAQEIAERKADRKAAEWKHAFDVGEVIGLGATGAETDNPYPEASNEYCGWSFGFWSGRGIADRKRLEQWEAEAQDTAHPKIRPMTRLENAYMDLEKRLGARIEALEKALQDAYVNGFHAGRTATPAAKESPTA
jgi:hypothetical protein